MVLKFFNVDGLVGFEVILIEDELFEDLILLFIRGLLVFYGFVVNGDV